MNLLGPKDALESPEQELARNNFYLKVALFFLVLLGGDLAYAWVLAFYEHVQIISTISFVGTDPSWIPKGTSFTPALGTHYFGDFEQYMGYAVSKIPPYSQQIVYPAAYGPAAVIMVKILNF